MMVVMIMITGKFTTGSCYVCKRSTDHKTKMVESRWRSCITPICCCFWVLEPDTLGIHCCWWWSCEVEGCVPALVFHDQLIVWDLQWVWKDCSRSVLKFRRGRPCSSYRIRPEKARGAHRLPRRIARCHTAGAAGAAAAAADPPPSSESADDSTSAAASSCGGFCSASDFSTTYKVWSADLHLTLPTACSTTSTCLQSIFRNDDFLKELILLRLAFKLELAALWPSLRSGVVGLGAAAASSWNEHSDSVPSTELPPWAAHKASTIDTSAHTRNIDIPAATKTPIMLHHVPPARRSRCNDDDDPWLRNPAPPPSIILAIFTSLLKFCPQCFSPPSTFPKSQN